MSVAKKQFSYRLSKESESQFASLVNWYRASIPVGRVSKDAVLAEIIRFCYEHMKAQQGGTQKVIKPPLEKISGFRN